jgi:hypothetical protein
MHEVNHGHRTSKMHTTNHAYHPEPYSILKYVTISPVYIKGYKETSFANVDKLQIKNKSQTLVYNRQ